MVDQRFLFLAYLSQMLSIGFQHHLYLWLLHLLRNYLFDSSYDLLVVVPLMKQVCLHCTRQAPVGSLWCQEVYCATDDKPVVLEPGESLGDIGIVRLVAVLRTAAVYEADRFPDVSAKPVDQRFATCPWAMYHVEVRSS